MELRIRWDESLSHGLRRVIKKQLRYALARLTATRPSPAAIHETRKRIKVARTIARLLRREIDVNSAEQHLRRASLLLGGLRDTEAVVAAARALCRTDRRILSQESCTSLVAALERDRLRLQRESRRTRAQVTDSVRGAVGAIDAWKWGDVDFDTVAASVRRSYRRARRQLKKTYGDQRAETFHDWRKRIKTLWYAIRMLERIVPSLRRESRRLKRLEAALGDAQDLVLLNARILALGVRDQESLRRQALRRQRQLQLKALESGQSIFKRRPGTFAEELVKP